MSKKSKSKDTVDQRPNSNKSLKNLTSTPRKDVTVKFKVPKGAKTPVRKTLRQQSINKAKEPVSSSPVKVAKVIRAKTPVKKMHKYQSVNKFNEPVTSSPYKVPKMTGVKTPVKKAQSDQGINKAMKSIPSTQNDQNISATNNKSLTSNNAQQMGNFEKEYYEKQFSKLMQIAESREEENERLRLEMKNLKAENQKVKAENEMMKEAKLFELGALLNDSSDSGNTSVLEEETLCEENTEQKNATTGKVVKKAGVEELPSSGPLQFPGVSRLLTGEGLLKETADREVKAIHEENLATLSRMSVEEIHKEREKLLKILDAEVVEFVRKKKPPLKNPEEAKERRETNTITDIATSEDPSRKSKESEQKIDPPLATSNVTIHPTVTSFDEKSDITLTPCNKCVNMDDTESDDLECIKCVPAPITEDKSIDQHHIEKDVSVYYLCKEDSVVLETPGHHHANKKSNTKKKQTTTTLKSKKVTETTEDSLLVSSEDDNREINDVLEKPKQKTKNKAVNKRNKSVKEEDLTRTERIESKHVVTAETSENGTQTAVNKRTKGVTTAVVKKKRRLDDKNNTQSQNGNSAVVVLDSPEEFSGPVSKASNGILRCTMCYRKKINPNESGSAQRHPDLNVLICKACYDFYMSGPIKTDSDGRDEQCRWCSDGGHLICCDFCHNAFCKVCIEENLGRKELSKLTELDDFKWHCYMCDTAPLSGLITECTAVLQCGDTKKRKANETAKTSQVKRKK